MVLRAWHEVNAQSLGFGFESFDALNHILRFVEKTAEHRANLI